MAREQGSSESVLRTSCFYQYCTYWHAQIKYVRVSFVSSVPAIRSDLLNTFVNRACGFFSSTACFADFYGHHDTKTVTIKKNCDLNGNNCKVEITYFHLGCNLSLPILCSSYSSTKYLFLIHFVPTDHQEGGAAPPPLSPPQRGGPHRPILRRPLDAAVADTTPRLASLNAPYTFDRGVLEPIRVCSEPTFARRSGSERRLSSEQASYGTSPVTAASAVSATLPRNAPFRLDPSLRPTVYRIERNPSQQPSAWGPPSQGNWTGIGCPLASSGRLPGWHAVPRLTSRRKQRAPPPEPLRRAGRWNRHRNQRTIWRPPE